MALLEVRGVSKSYRDGEKTVEVLKGIDLSLEEGGFASIQGASGAGKSTLLHILGALLEADAGEVELKGSRLSEFIKGNRLNEYRRDFVGFIFQNHYLMPDFNILENVMMPLLIEKMPRKRAAEEATEALDAIGLSHRLTHYPSQISGGESQRVAIARAVVKKPALVLADEPTGNLDSANSKKFIERLMELRNKENLTVLVATHEKELANLADHMYLMEDGVLSSH